jgi:hypothetical protein
MWTDYAAARVLTSTMTLRGHELLSGNQKSKVMEESGRALRDAHLSDDKTVAKMGHPDLWWVRN